ncbi:MAG: GAF domain-containing protein [Sphaerochaetaceae bacterium]|nr:GAF domain-containing protein [Sphaerochaetaceae bacterium]
MKNTLTDELLSQVEAFTRGVDTSSFLDVNALFANVSALLFGALDTINWCGFYYLKDDGDLILGPFAGRPACILLKKGHGVCQKAIETSRMVIVNDVHTFDGHIACDSESMSECVFPLHREGKVFAVLDIDSPEAGHFTNDVLDLWIRTAALLDSIL